MSVISLFNIYEENFENSAAAARQEQLKKVRIAQEISTKECPSSVILLGKYYWCIRDCCLFAYTYVFLQLRLPVKFEQQHV